MAEEVKDTPRATRGPAKKSPPARRRRGHTRLSGKNQVTIPVDALAKAGLRPGDELKVETDDRGRIVLCRSEEARLELIDKYAGSMPGVFPPGYLAEMRDEWDR